MTICIFPGTFNPIHNGHIKMAEYALREFCFDKIIFIPSCIPPHKDIDKSLANHRLNMVKLAVEYNPNFEVSDIEYKSSEKSYSINTVKFFIDKYSLKEKINFIIGTDAFINLNKWYKAEELKNLVHFIVFPRKGSEDKESFNYYLTNGWDFEITNMDYIDISSTDIRETHNNTKIQEQVGEYIKSNGLY